MNRFAGIAVVAIAGLSLFAAETEASRRCCKQRRCCRRVCCQSTCCQPAPTCCQQAPTCCQPSQAFARSVPPNCTPLPVTGPVVPGWYYQAYYFADGKVYECGPFPDQETCKKTLDSKCPSSECCPAKECYEKK